MLEVSMDPIVSKMRNIGIIPVVKIDDEAKAVPLAKALIAGGIPCAEVTFRTAQAEEAIKRISQSCPEMLVGAGTVINVELAKKAISAGAAFIVSPGFNPSVVDYCISQKVPIIPGVTSPSQIEQALEKGLTELKFFPAEQSGGVSMLDALGGPFPQVSFMPTGGISSANLSDYIKRKNVIACGGSWMVKADLIESENWNEITRLSKEAICAVHGFSFAHMGINQQNVQEAGETASLFAAFGFALNRDGETSVFAGNEFEVMKSVVRGKNGHIGLKTWDIERALAYLEQFGFKPVKETLKYTGKEGQSPLKFTYLDKEVGGFAFHLMRA